MINRIKYLATCPTCGCQHTGEFLLSDERLEPDDPTYNNLDIHDLISAMDLDVCEDCRKPKSLNDFCQYLMSHTFLEA